MKKIFGSILLTVFLIGTAAFTGNAVAQQEDEIVTGEVIEIAAAEHIIQVKNRNYVVIAVYIDDGIRSEPEPGFFTDIKVGSLVELHINGKSNGFWQAKEVIIFTGDKEKKVLKSLE